jgi:carbon monoxide dehydrogenase subunit G
VRIESSFEVPAAADEVWALLMDVPRVVPCMPGAELIETVDESTWKTKMSVKLGPMTLGFTADVKREEAEETAGECACPRRHGSREGEAEPERPSSRP